MPFNMQSTYIRFSLVNQSLIPFTNRTLSYMNLVSLCLCGDIQSNFIFDACILHFDNLYVEVSLYSWYLIHFKPSLFETILIPFVNLPFLKISISGPLTFIVCLGLQTILGLHVHVILGVLKLNITKVPLMLLHHKIVFTNLKISYHLLFYIYSIYLTNASPTIFIVSLH